ncbi:MAG: LptF/LptG family permease [Planctomycetia bacterium]|nr:MAG: LptF/LptG family permease [Planctomycetia bacterium]
MLLTLHSYILRDLLKTFLLTILAITAIITLGGGIINVIRFEGVTSEDILLVVPLLVPVVVTVVMPVAALFAASIVYGRLAADQEFQACRAAGINIHRLFAPVILLALAVAAFTTLSGSFVIPECVRQIERLSRANARDWVRSQLVSRGHVRFRDRFFLTAASAHIPSADDLRRANHDVTPGFSYLYIASPTVLELDDGGTPKVFASARGGLLSFDTRQIPIKATLIAEDVRMLRPPEHAVEFAIQTVGPTELPLTLPEKPGWADLPTLLRWRAAPWEWAELRDRLRGFLGAVGAYTAHVEIGASLAAGRSVTLSDNDIAYVIRCATVVADQKDITLTDAHIEQRLRNTLRATFEAPQAKLTARPQSDVAGMLANIALIPAAGRPVTETSPGPGARIARHEKPLNLPPVHIDVPERAAALRPPQVLDRAFEIENLPEPLALARRGLQREGAVFGRKVLAEIHMRLAFTSANVVTLVMAAALGLLFRGARALTAFAVANVPFLFVLMITYMGKQITVDERFTSAGPYVMWSGLALCALADVLILRFGVRR